ncbi:butyrophilin subfamily 1 member A1-like isoform X2 [Anser cygnoides]|uniref:butyrophilin subfamily 1 member A1-like isoform X2 n=1 Tax=Anser cygnoides TaxID=8845 RepID=UPI0034D19AE7
MGLPWGCGCPSLTGHARGLLTSLVTLLLLRLGSAQLRVEGPDHPLTATVGQDVVLPCHLSPRKDAGTLDIRWIRDDISETVHHYRNGEDLYREQMWAYAGRTELARDGLSAGSLDLRITRVRPSDDGHYFCTVKDVNAYHEAIVELEVSATGADPHLSLGGYEAGGVRVLCRSAGWYPLPQVLWRDARGQHLPSVSQTHSQDQEGLFEIEGTIIVTGSVEGPLSCVVRSSRIQQEREFSLHIAAPFFHNAQPFIVALALVLVLLAVSIGLAVYLFRKKVAQSRELAAKKDAKLVEQAAEIEEKAAILEKQGAELAWRRCILPQNRGRCALGCPLQCFSCPCWGMFRSQEVPHLLPRGAAPGPELGKACPGLSSAPDGLAPSVPAVKVTLDPDTAHPLLVLSEDRRSVRWESKSQEVPDTVERFETRCCVLGCEEFREGRHWWEVEVEGETGRYYCWAVGVARASVKRKGLLIMNPEEGIWAVQYDEGQLMSLTSPRTHLSLSPVPTRIWVCLDCTQGQVSFINADNGVEIFTFTAASFNGESIRPWFLLWTQGIQLCLRDSTPQTLSPALEGSCPSPPTPGSPLLGPEETAQE